VSLLLGPVYDGGAPANGTVAFAGDDVVGFMAACWTLGFDGWIYKQHGRNQAAVRDGAWIDPQVGMNLYEVRATATDTTPPDGTYDTWLDLGNSWSWCFHLFATDPYWRDEATGTRTAEDKEGVIFIEIRRKSDEVVIASGNVDVFAAGNA
jgi:hypothetical protein